MTVPVPNTFQRPTGVPEAMAASVNLMEELLRLRARVAELESEAAQVRAMQREADARICDEYAERMKRAVESSPRSTVADCKMDAGQTLAKRIREQKP